MPPAELPVRSLHLDHPDAVAGELSGEAGAPGTGAFDPDNGEFTEAARPGEEPPVAGGCGRELGGAEHDTDRVEHGGDVGVFVGVDPAGDGHR